jgi:NADH:ubiquinone oxidoreductase subunit H
LIIFRRTYPRYRYDIMMSFYWFILLPISIWILFFYSVVKL